MRNKPGSKFLLCFLLCCSASLPLMAQDNAPSNPMVDDSLNGTAWALGLMLIFAVAFLFYLLGQMSTLTEPEKQPLTLKQRWAKFNERFLTKSIPLEQEADHLLDHDYDGIRELDNSLPPWWKYGFYFTIVFAVFYMFRFHVWKTGPTPEQEYNQEMAMAAKQVEEYRKKVGDMVDEKTVTMADASGIAEGQKIFQSTCFACHGAKGEGGVGPNLTDSYWLHGGTINEVFKTIKYGVPDKGMQSWQKTYSPSQIKNIASYIKTLAGTNPPNAKAPQGEPFEEPKTDTKPAAVKNSTAIAKR